MASGMPTEVRVLIWARAVNQLGGFSLAFLTVLLADSFGAGLAIAGVVSAAFGLATIPSRLAGGRLADGWGRRRTIVAGLIGCSVAQLGLAAAPNLALAAVSAVLLGLAFELFEPPSQSLIADSVVPADRASAFGLLTTALAVGSLGAGVIADVVGRWSLRWLFVADAATGIACAVMVLFTLAPDSVAKRPSEPDVPRDGIVSPWRDRALLIATVSGTVFALIAMMFLVALPLSLSAVGLRPSDAGLLMAASTATLVLARPITRTGPLATMPHGPIFAIGYVLMGIGMLGYAAAHTLPTLVVPTAAYSLGNLLVMGRSFAVVSELAPPAASARYLAVYGLSWGVATLIAPLVATWLIDASGPGLLWTFTAGLSGVMAAGQPWLVRWIGRIGRERVDLDVIRSTNLVAERYDAVSI
ncbi:MAG: MFS transporter [Catenulisporales bacterium]|nr:MFS transporter [Catenulisporales bacterium]